MHFEDALPAPFNTFYNDKKALKLKLKIYNASFETEKYYLVHAFEKLIIDQEAKGKKPFAMSTDFRMEIAARKALAEQYARNHKSWHSLSDNQAMLWENYFQNKSQCMEQLHTKLIEKNLAVFCHVIDAFESGKEKIACLFNPEMAAGYHNYKTHAAALNHA